MFKRTPRGAGNLERGSQDQQPSACYSEPSLRRVAFRKEDHEGRSEGKEKLRCFSKENILSWVADSANVGNQRGKTSEGR